MEKFKKNSDYTKVRRSGKKHSTSLFDVYLLPNNASTFRVGVLTSKKFSKSAVKRNKARRLLLEALRMMEDKEKPSFDCLVVVKQPMLEAEYQDVAKNLERVLQGAFKS